MSNCNSENSEGNFSNRASQIANEIFEAASVIAIPFSKFVPIINDIVGVTEDITQIYQSAEHNKRISLVLVERIAAVETSLRYLKIHKDDQKNFFNQENFVVMQKLLDNIQKIKKFIGEVTQLKGLSKYIQAKTIQSTFFDLTNEFDGYINTLKFAIAVDTQARAERTERGITDMDNNISKTVKEISVIKKTNETRGKKVRKYIRLINDEAVSFKLVADESDTNDVKNDIRSHVTILMKLKECHQIIQFYGLVSDGERRYLVTEWAECGNLREFYEKYGGPIDAKTKINIAVDIARGLNFLRAIVHRDIRPENILITANETAKIANFSLSRHFRDETRRLAVSLQTVRYSAPEMLYRNTNKYNTKCEVYSFGILLWELAEQKIPYKHLDDIMEIKNRVDKEKYREPFTNFSNLPKEYKEISIKAVGADPDFRPTITEMFKTLEKLQANFLALRPLTPINVPTDFSCEPKDKEVPRMSLTPEDDDNIKISEVINFAEFNYMTMKEATLAHRVTNGNLEMAYKCFNAYAQTGNLKAKYFLGYYLYKKLVNTSYSDKDREKRAAQLFKEVADSGDEVPDAQLKYGLCLFQGTGVDRNFSDAAKYFQKAADNGLAVGMYNAGNIFYAGLTGVKDEELGIKYIREAAQHNHSEAMDFSSGKHIVARESVDN
ncbi:36896_t:CDS:2 [Gigaspora margarita]|uniref:36896_t:CDS:1 n=1 Tax=Gigaspora margarita TaxID=4874 RepID=A0ABN7UMT2_GIGMA|nr:36896_t:CDS:2 [Gigaspora margarita]